MNLPLHNLITADQRAHTAAARGEERDPLPIVKLFTPDANATWLLTELDPADEITALAYVTPDSAPPNWAT